MICSEKHWQKEEQIGNTNISTFIKLIRANHRHFLNRGTPKVFY
jgi:hypothetical protein